MRVTYATGGYQLEVKVRISGVQNQKGLLQPTKNITLTGLEIMLLL